MAEIVRPTIARAGPPRRAFRGVLFAGLMITPKGPKLIEYNVRFGDPECQVLMMRLKDDLLTMLNAAVDGELDHVSVRWRDEAALTVVMAANGYPGAYERARRSAGCDEAAAVPGVEIFHAGTRREDGAHRRRWRPRAQRHRPRTHASPRRRRAPIEAVDRDRLAAGLLPPRHRLARRRPTHGRLRD